MRRLGFRSFVRTGGQTQVGAGTAMERTDMKRSEAERRRATCARP